MLASLEDTDFAISDTISELKRSEIVQSGDSIVIVFGSSANVGSTNTMKIEYA